MQYGELGGGLIVSPSELIFKNTGDTKTLQILNIHEYEWEVVGAPSWISYSPASGNALSSTIVLTASQNNGDTERSGDFVIWNRTKDETTVIPVSQPLVPYLRLVPSSVIISSQGGTATVNVESNIDWSLKISGETAVVTGLTIDNFEWTSNFPSSAGTYLTKDYSTFNVTAHYDDGTTTDATNEAEITGQVTLEENTTAKSRIVQAPINAYYENLYTSVMKKGFQSGAPLPLGKPLTFNILSAGTINWKATNSSETKTIEYKINNGNWASITSNAGETAPTITVNAGDKIQFRGNNAQYGGINKWGKVFYNSFGGSTAGFSVEGNIMSLIYGDDFKNKLTINSVFAFARLFINCTNLVSAENLVLPATTLATSCYDEMFKNCTSLITAPALPATTLANSCYVDMFENCSSLTTAPELPATTLADSCYVGMFSGCKSLTTAPALPATTLSNICYSHMFYGCTSLTTAPELPATTLTNNCYQEMFYNCTSLNYIKCLATDISATNCTNGWVFGVAATGTFIEKPNATWETGNSGIPTGWTVLDDYTTQN